MIASTASRAWTSATVALLVIGCGGGGGGGAGGGNAAASAATVPVFDACALVTAADAAEVLGGPASQPEQYTRLDRRDDALGTAISNCVYARDGTYRTLSVVVSYRGDEQPASFDALKAAGAAAGGVPATITKEMLDASEPVAGIGDFGFWTGEIHTLTVYARRHYQVSVNVDPASPGDAAGARAGATTLAERILGRL